MRKHLQSGAMHPAKKVRELFEHPPKPPKTGWRIWRDPTYFIPTRTAGYWHVQLWIDGRLKIDDKFPSSYQARQHVFITLQNMDSETKKKIRLHEAFNEAEE